MKQTLALDTGVTDGMLHAWWRRFEGKLQSIMSNLGDTCVAWHKVARFSEEL
jgi:hypothetical protein